MPPATDDFAAVLKKARLAAGLSQAEVADRAGVTGSYVCLLELRRKPAPSPEVVARLARALAVEETPLQELAALERTPEPVRQRVLRLVRERGRVRRTRDTLLTTTVFHMTRRPGFWSHLLGEALDLPEERRLLLGRIADRVKVLPTLDQARSRSDEILLDVPGRDRDALVRVLPSILAGASAEAPASITAGGAEPVPSPTAEPPPAATPEERPWRAVPVLASLPSGAAGTPIDTFHVDRRTWQDGCFFLVAADDDAYPRVERGDLLLVHPRAAAADGDLVVVPDGPRARVRVYRRRGDEVRLESPRTDVPPLRVPAARFEAAGVVVWIHRPLRGLPPPRRARGGDRSPNA